VTSDVTDVVDLSNVTVRSASKTRTLTQTAYASAMITGADTAALFGSAFVTKLALGVADHTQLTAMLVSRTRSEMPRASVSAILIGRMRTVVSIPGSAILIAREAALVLSIQIARNASSTRLARRKQIVASAMNGGLGRTVATTRDSARRRV
jgi:hypothetical protein